MQQRQHILDWTLQTATVDCTSFLTASDVDQGCLAHDGAFAHDDTMMSKAG